MKRFFLWGFIARMRAIYLLIRWVARMVQVFHFYQVVHVVVQREAAGMAILTEDAGRL